MDRSIESLSREDKRRLLEQLLKQKLRVERSTFPLSYGQKALWFLYKTEPDHPTLNMFLDLLVHEQSDPDYIRRSFVRLLERHDQLRMVVDDSGNEPVQRIGPVDHSFFSSIDTSTWSSSDLDIAIKAEKTAPFDLVRGPLFRVKLFFDRKGDHRLIIVQHHITGDAYSWSLIMNDWLRFLTAERSGIGCTLPRPGSDYYEFVHWQHEYVESDRGNRDWEYWKRYLHDSGSLLPLPSPASSQSGAGYGGEADFVIERGVAQRIREVARNEGTTVNMFLLAAFKTFLYRLTGQEDLIVGMPTLGRDRPGFDQVVGYFTDPVMIRTRLQGDPPFREVLARVRNGSLGALEHQDFPVSLIVERTRTESHTSRAPAFQVMFNVLKSRSLFEQVNLDESVNSALPRIEVVELGQPAGQFDLMFEITDTGDDLLCVLKYSYKCFDRVTIDRWTRCLSALIRSAVEHINRPISALEMMTEMDLQVMQSIGECRSRLEPDTRYLHHLFEEQAARTPEAVAVCAGEKTITYEHLDRFSEGLAHLLQDASIGSEDLVAILMDRSIEMVAAMIAVLKAGGAFLPMDPAYPADRLLFMLEDSNCRTVLVHETRKAHYIGLLGGFEGDIRGVTLDREERIHDRTWRKQLADPSKLAYVIYTSGSTGRPRGVEIEHRSAVNFIKDAVDRYDIGPSDRVLQFASPGFDTAIEEVFPCLSSGGTLVLRTPEMISSTENFLAACRSMKVSVLDLPTAFWHELTREIHRRRLTLPDSIRLVIIGGERARNEHLQEWHVGVGDTIRLVNTYGPTETTVVATAAEITRELNTTEIPIGKGISGVDLYVLDRHLNPVPPGVEGELYIGGVGLARGYRNNQTDTRNRFIPSPFDRTHRLFKTGDLVRWTDDGELLFSGRKDDQVKIRGYRVETGEIESILTRHPSVEHAIVSTYPDATDTLSLAAYIVPVLTQDLEHELRGFLKKRLPDYMVPGLFIPLNRIPLTENGKVDYKKLPDPTGFRSGTVTGYVAPRTDLERQIVSTWSELLDIEQIGIYDNFFELGGHSLLTMRLISRLQQSLAVDLTINDVFEYPTVTEMAARIVEIKTGEVDEKKLDQLLQEVEDMSDEDVRTFLNGH